MSILLLPERRVLLSRCSPLQGLIVTGLLVLLSACGGEEGATTFDEDGGTELYYSYPYDGQQAVPPHAPIVLRFSDPVSLDASNLTLFECAPDVSRCDSSNAVATVPLAAPHSSGNGRGAVLAPQTGSLKTGTGYSLRLTDLVVDDQAVTLPKGSLAFHTRLANEGPLRDQIPDPQLAITRIVPDGELPLLDFSTVSVRFNQPLDSDTVAYGDNVSLKSGGELVPAAVWTRGSALVIDPENALVPGKAYTLLVMPGVKGLAGDGLDSPMMKSWIARNTEPRATMVQRAAAADDCDQPSPSSTSMLTGMAINCVPVIARLLGDTTVSRQSGDVFAELAYAPNFPEVTPLRIPRGALLKGDPLKVMIGGQVDAGFDSGEVTVTFLSDATGYLIPNPNSVSPNAPRQLRLNIDVAFATEEPRANGAFTQTLLQVELVGTARADTSTGSLVTDAVGVVEPEVLGVETAYGVLSFHMESYPDQNNAPAPQEDMTPPTLQAWQPGESTLLQRPGDPVVLNFSEPLDPGSVQAAGEADDTLLMTRDGMPEPFQWRVDGAALVLQPDNPLAHGAQYQVLFTDGIRDIAGNGAVADTLTFSLPDYAAGNARAPLVLSAYPGFPCNTVGRDLAANRAGRCVGGRDGTGTAPEGAGPVMEDDHLPLARLPVNRDIKLTFSQTLDADSVNADTFVVEAVDEMGQPQGSPLPGLLKAGGRTLTFTPEDTLQAGELYRYALHSVVDNPVCGSDAICDSRGLPLQTRLLYPGPENVPAAQQGGESLVVYFRADEASDEVLQGLRNLPTVDVNASLIREASEVGPSVDPAAISNSAFLEKGEPAAEGQLIADFDIGCPGDAFVTPDLSAFPALEAQYSHLYTDMPAAPCPDNHYLFLNGNLTAEIDGYLSAEEVLERFGDDPLIPDAVKAQGGVLAYIHPSRIVTTGTTVYPVLTDIATSLTQAVLPAPTGPQIMRIRYSCDANPAAGAPCAADDQGRVKGWIIDGASEPQFVTRLNLYLDAPQLEPVAVLAGIAQVFTHNLHSYPLTLGLSGEVTFLDDGRLEIHQLSTQALPVDVYLGGMVADLVVGADAIHMQIPEGRTELNYVSEPVKP